MRRNYVLAGLGLGAIVFVAIVLAGSLGTSSSQTTSGAGTPATGQSLPAGHPPVDAASAPASAASSGSGDQYAAMIATLEKKHAKDPANTGVTLALANAYLMSEKPDKAMALYQDVLRRKPGDPQATAGQAMAYHAKGNDAKALQLLAGVIAADPGNQTAHYNLAIIYFSQDNTSEARTEWQKTAAIDPKSRLGMAAQSFIDLMDGKTPAASGQ